MSKPLSRRAALALPAAASAAWTAISASRVLGANDRVGLALIGAGSRGCQVLEFFLKHGVSVPAICDVARSSAEAANGKYLAGRAAVATDFRRVLERKDVDAVLIATPDHWHALQTIHACRAGKDVYVEKPLSKTIREGRRMVEVARQTGRVVQMGTHRRSGHAYQAAARLVASGKIGKVTVARAFDTTNMFPKGIGKAGPSDPPADLDWEMWLGPRPSRPYQATITPFRFRWWDLYASRYSDNGVHFLDIMRWISGDEAGPALVTALGGRFAVDDDRTTPDVMEGLFQFASGRLLSFAQYETSGNRAMPRPALAEFRGTQGCLYVGDGSLEVLPERGGRYQDDQGPRTEPIAESFAGGYAQHVADHTGNFLECLRTRQRPNADVEIGHRSTSMALLANIALATQATLAWDAQKERITNHPQANDLLHYEYRQPWSLD